MKQCQASRKTKKRERERERATEKQSFRFLLITSVRNEEGRQAVYILKIGNHKRKWLPRHYRFAVIDSLSNESKLVINSPNWNLETNLKFKNCLSKIHYPSRYQYPSDMGHAGLQELLLEHVSPHSRPGRIVRSNVIRAQEKTIDPCRLKAHLDQMQSMWSWPDETKTYKRSRHWRRS